MSARSPDIDERILAHLSFARAVASRTLDPRCRGADREDLIAAGVVGLVQARDKLAPLRNRVRASGIRRTCGLRYVTTLRRSQRTKNASHATAATSTAIEADRLRTSPYRTESARPA